MEQRGREPTKIEQYGGRKDGRECQCLCSIIIWGGGLKRLPHRLGQKLTGLWWIRWLRQKRTGIERGCTQVGSGSTMA